MIKANLKTQSYFFLHFRIQAALVIRGLGIRGFDYSRIIIWYQVLLSADFSLAYPRTLAKKCNILPDFAGKITVLILVNLPLLSAVLVFAGNFWNVTPANNEGRLTDCT